MFDEYECFQLLVQHRLIKSGLNAAASAALIVDLKPVFLPDETLFCLLRSEPLPDQAPGTIGRKRRSGPGWIGRNNTQANAMRSKIARDGVARKRNKDPDDLEAVPVFYAYHGKILEFEALLLDPANKAVLCIDVHSVQAEVQAIRDLNWKRKKRLVRLSAGGREARPRRPAPSRAGSRDAVPSLAFPTRRRSEDG